MTALFPQIAPPAPTAMDVPKSRPIHFAKQVTAEEARDGSSNGHGDAHDRVPTSGWRRT